MTDMTPAPISVERLSPAISDYPGNHFEDAEPIMVATLDGEYVRHSDYAALLQQLAERGAEVERLKAEVQRRHDERLQILQDSGSDQFDLMKRAEAAESKLAERDSELSALRQACWDARAVLGFDNDGDPTPDALVYPSLADLVRRDAAEFRKGYDEACNEAHAAERAREGACGLLRESIGEIRDAATDARVANLPSRGAHLDKLAARIAAFLAASGGGGHVSPAGAPTAQQPLDESANNAGVATGSRNDSPSESVTRGSLPASDSICDALTAEWQAMGLYDATPASGGPRDG